MSETQWVLVETVSQHRMRYMVEVPVGKAEYALDAVVCEEAKEFSQEFIGETIVSHRVLTEQEALNLCDIDNQYFIGNSKERKIETFFTCLDELVEL